MGLLDIARPSRKKARPVGQKLETGRPTDAVRSGSRNLWVKGGIVLGLVVLTMAAFPRDNFYRYSVQVGDEWRGETLIAPVDFPIYKSQEDLEAERRGIRYRTPPFFREVPDAMEMVEANRDSLLAQLQRTLSAYESYLRNRSRGRMEEASQDSARYMALRRNARLKATAEQWGLLAQSFVEQAPDLASTHNGPRPPRLDLQMLENAFETSVELMSVGVMDVPQDSIYTDEIVVRNEQENTQRTPEKTSVFGLNEAYQAVQQRAREAYPDSPVLANLQVSFFRAIFHPTLEYQRGDTVREWQRLESRIPPTLGKVSEGDEIIRKGQRVSEETRLQLTSLARALNERTGANISLRSAFGQLLLTLSVYALYFLYLFLLRRSVFDDNRRILLIALLFAGVIGLYAAALRLENGPIYAVPVAIASVLLTVVFDSRVGLFGTISLALIGGALLQNDFEFAFATIFAGALGVFSVRDIKNRGQFFLSAALVFVGYSVVITANWLVMGTSLDAFLSDLLLVGINSFLLIMAYPLLWVFERAFDVTTDLTLLELSDTNRPLLKELSLRAPGTFNHSLQVANLGEAAADAIGANALLTRVGALYHDIGKMLKPEYFVENQRPGDNPHDHLKPRMSALIIASHVKEGLELGRQYNLPERVLNFIPMHHGTTRIEYFYQKALKERGPDDPPLLESEFRYPGPRPDSKETGIMMLADSVEAASRSLSDPTHKRLETLVDMIFKARTEDGQLDNTDLTFLDLHRIRETFLAMLLGIYHVRVKYPGQAESEATGALAEPPQEAEVLPVATEPADTNPPAPPGDGSPPEAPVAEVEQLDVEDFDPTRRSAPDEPSGKPD
ncbi:MAG TPA: HDIG domain-containing protein [Rhodothermales bacterium]